MKTLTIDKSLDKEEDIVLISRRDYEQLISDSSKEVIKRDPKIDREIRLALKDVRKGKVEGPFHSVEEFMSSLRFKKAPRRAKR